MQIFSAGSKKKKKSTHQATAAKAKKKGKCRALCCGGSRLSISSSCSSDAPEMPPAPPPGLSNLAHGMVQARLQAMIDDRMARQGADHRSCICGGGHGGGRRRSCNCSGGGGCGAHARACIVLVAMDKRSYNPREDFRRSIMEVIMAKRMAEPAELRGLLNCYVSMNAREHRAAILEAFHEVCSSLFSCKGGES